MSRPLFVTVDALDGVGKTTLVSRLAVHLGGVAMDTPGPSLRALRQGVLDGLGPDQLARCVFYLSTVIAEGHKARSLVASGISVVMDRYWPSTAAYARARGVAEDLHRLADLVPRADVSVMLTLDEDERVRRLVGRGKVTAADRETLNPTFRDRVLRDLRATTDVVVDVSGASPEEAVVRVSDAIDTYVGRLGGPIQGSAAAASVERGRRQRRGNPSWLVGTNPYRS
jgi:dTMP kinase